MRFSCLCRGVSAAVVLVTLLWAPGLVFGADLEINLRRDTYYRDKRVGAWAVRIRFNRAVFPSSLKSATAVTSNGSEETFELQAPQSGQIARKPLKEFRLVPQKVTSSPQTVKIVVKKGLADATGRNLLAEDAALQFTSLARIEVSYYSKYHKTRSDKGLFLSLSDYVPVADLSKAIEVTPAVKDLKVFSAGYNRYRVSGLFAYDQPYVLHIRPITVNDGQAILEDRDIPFKGPGIAPNIGLTSKGSVIELKGRQLLPISLADVTKVRCNLTRIPPFLVADAPGELGGTLTPGGKKWRKNLKNLKNLVAKGSVDSVFGCDGTEDADVFFAREVRDHVYRYSLPLSFRADPEKGGAWWVQLIDPDLTFEGKTTRLIQITDLSVSYKLSAKTLVLWVTSIHSGEPVAGVHLLVQDRAGTRFFVGQTDKEGLLTVRDGEQFSAISAEPEAPAPARKPLALSQVKVVVAATATDSCAVALTSERLKPFSVKQTDKPEAEPEARRGYLFTERGIYLPGETVHFKFVMRAYQEGRIVPPVGEKVRIQIVDPRDEIQYNKVVAIGEFGTCHDSFEVKPFFRVGTYTLRARSVRDADEKKTRKKKVEWFTRTFEVGEYKRPRHFVSISAKPEQRPASDFVGVDIQEDYLLVEVSGQYYSGGPVKHARARWKATLVPVTTDVKGIEGYFFGNADTDERFLESGESILDKQGNLKLTIPLDKRLLTGLYGVRVSATVIDVDGEPATEVTTFHPKPTYQVGISLHPKRVQKGYASPLRVVVVDQEGNRVDSGALKVSIMKQDYFYVQKRDEEGNINHLWEEGWVTFLSSKASIVKAEALFEMELRTTGEYLVAFTFEDQKGAQYTSQTIFRVGWDEYDNWLRSQYPTSVPTSNEILLGLSRKEYRVGEAVTVEFDTKRPLGKCLVALETGDILDYKVIDVNGTHGTYRFTAQEKFKPNVYVSIIGAAGRRGYPVYRTQTDNDIPTVFYGYAAVRIRRELKGLNLEIEPDAAELKGRPGEDTTLNFIVTDKDGKGCVTEMAVCIVDEAVLALTRYVTPDLSTLTDFKLPLAVFSGDLRGALISQDLFRMLSTNPLTGGGMGFGLVESSLRKDFRPVAYFNPALVSDESGRVRVEFKLPDTTTAYRVYAVVCDKGSGFVSGQRKMVVNKEFYVEPSLPRFLIPGDKVILPVLLYNKTDTEGTVALEATSSEELKVNLTQVPGKLEAYSSVRAAAKIEAGGGADKGKVLFKGSFSGKSGKFGDAIELPVPIHSRFLPVNRAIIGGFVEKGEISVELPVVLKTLNAEDMTSDDFKAYLIFSTTNWAQIEPGLRYLLRYPYGCIEQTSSGVIPLAGLRGLIRSGAVPGTSIEEVDKFLTKGVNRLLSMQTSSGGFAYWPGRLDSSWWGTLYATFALTLARDAGFEVPDNRFSLALRYLRDNLFGKSGTDRYHGSKWTKELALFTLAVNGQLGSNELEPFFSEYDSLSNQSRALLLLAAKKVGHLDDKTFMKKVSRLDPSFDPRKKTYYNSSYRTIALCLLAALEAKLPKKADKWAAYLIEGLKRQGGRCYSTADTGWCLLALGRYFQGKEPGKSQLTTVNIRIGDGKTIEVPISEASESVELDPHRLLNAGKIRLTCPALTLINYSLYLTYPDVVSDPSELNQGFILNKKIVNLNGKKEIRVGDVVRITVEIEIPRRQGYSYDYRYLEYLALEDPVPAGLVPINSELKTEGVLGDSDSTTERAAWRDGFYEFNPTYSEFRDDGVRVFRDRAYEGSYRYTYLARAVMEGDFWMRGSRISLMYEPEVFGKTQGRRVVILPMAK